MDDSFGHWLSGFIDGEGCFRVHKGKGGSYYATCFTLKLRDDDTPILQEIVRKTGVGHLKPDNTRSGNSKPCTVWTVQSKEMCLKLVDLLDRFPLRARKAADYAIWREAVFFWVNQKRGHRSRGPRDWSQMIAFKEAIEHARTYQRHDHDIVRPPPATQPSPTYP